MASCLFIIPLRHLFGEGLLPRSVCRLHSANLELDAARPSMTSGLYETRTSVETTRRRFLSTVLSALHHGYAP